MEWENTKLILDEFGKQFIDAYRAGLDAKNGNASRDLYNSLLNTLSTDKADRYFILKDFYSYAEAQKKVEKAYRNSDWWAEAAIRNVANVGKFSSDRTIQDYVNDIWHLEKITVTVPEEQAE